MPKPDFDRAVDSLLAKNSKFTQEAFFLVRDALNHTLKDVHQKRPGEEVHIRGQALCEGFRSYAIEQYGPMVPTLLDFWGIRCTRDIGEIVFLLIEEGAFSQSPEDSLKDFENVYDFTEVFEVPFRPSNGKTRPSVG